jgi:hypothetical protein
MSFGKKIQSVLAGAQFDGTADKGLFEWPKDKTGVQIRSIGLDMGSEPGKTWLIFSIGPLGDKKFYESGAGAVANVVLTGEIDLVPGEVLKVVTVGATSAMSCAVTIKDEGEDVSSKGD